MTQKRGETQEQYMDRLRAVRGLPPMREDPQIMERTRAAVCLINTGCSETAKLSAFLAIFHPEIEPHGKLHMELMQDSRRRDGRR